MILSLASCNNFDAKLHPYVHGIDEQGFPFIVDHEGHFVNVMKVCQKEDCKDWKSDWVSISLDNLAEIEAAIRKVNRRRGSSWIKDYRNKIKTAKSFK